MNNTAQKCQACHKEFLIIDQEMTFYKQKNLPLPLHCFECRRKRRAGLRGERKLYDRSCDKCGAKLLSPYSEKTPYTVYCEKCYLENIG